MKQRPNFEDVLMTQLSDFKLDKATLKRYSSIIVGLKKQDIIIDRVWKYGIPAPDGVIVRGRLSIKDIAKLIDPLRVPEIYGLEIFPIGIPFPDFIDIRFKLGEQLAGQ